MDDLTGLVVVGYFKLILFTGKIQSLMVIKSTDENL